MCRVVNAIRVCGVYPVGCTIVIRCSTVSRTHYCASCGLRRTSLHDWSHGTRRRDHITDPI